MPSGNFGELTAPGPAEQPPRRPFRFPAEYYCAPLSEVRPMFPRWVPFGCGTAAAILLVLTFVAGAVVSGARFGEFMDFIVGTSLGELRSMETSDITPAEKQQFEAEVARMREGIRSGKIAMKNLQPFIKDMQSAVSDKRVTPEELDKLTKAAHDAQATSNRQPPAR